MTRPSHTSLARPRVLDRPKTTKNDPLVPLFRVAARLARALEQTHGEEYTMTTRDILEQAIARSGLGHPADGERIAEHLHDGDDDAIATRFRFSWARNELRLRMVPHDQSVLLSARCGPFTEERAPFVPYLQAEFPDGPALVATAEGAGFQVFLTQEVVLVGLSLQVQLDDLHREVRRFMQRVRLCLRLLECGDLAALETVIAA